MDEEGDGVFAVDKTVVITEGEVHDGSNDNLSFEGDWAVDDVVHAEDGALGGIEDGG